MTFDSSRFTFDPGRDFLGVVMQQGRVQLDSDWNELVSQALRRMQAGTLDTMGRAVVPRETPRGFLITLTGGKLHIGAGRMYVDGLLVENHGKRDWKKPWDVALAELKGTDLLDYTAQPYYPEPPALPPTAAASPYLVYLDVWQRDVTYLQYPELVEKAVGIDTTGRLQTVWQVKILQDIGEGATCESVSSTDKWMSLTRPSGARLYTSTGTVTGAPDPCQIPSFGGYKGLENQLYRVEIHDGGPMETATFKWSRDNATVASRISRINPGLQSIVVESVGRDEVLRFSDGDWVEITDDVRELHGDTGIMRRIKLGNGVDIATNTIMLVEQLPVDMLRPDADGQIVLRSNTRVRRWDQKGQILREDGTVYFDLDSPDREREVPEGVIPVPDRDTTLLLENGILLRFNRVSEHDFHTGDYWNFAARTADASIEILTDAPPRGIHHHYARLAVVTSTADTVSPIVSDCRVLWPPEVGAGHDCSCDQCITPEGGIEALQKAVDTLAPTGGVICLSAGIFYLARPLSITNARSLRIRGKGPHTLLIAGARSAVQVMNSRNVVIENLAAVGAATGNVQVDLIDARNTLGLELDHLNLFVLSPGDNASSSMDSRGVTLTGYTLGFRMRECSVVAEAGILGTELKTGFGLTSAVAVTDNLFVCRSVGISFPRETLHYSQIRIAHNLIFGAREVGIQVLGGALPGSNCLIEGNVLHLSHPTGQAVVVGTDGLRVADNEILGPGDNVEGSGVNGVVLELGLDPRGISHCWIIGNRISNMQGSGIAVRTFVGVAMIKQNIIERTGRGIVFTNAGSAGHLSIENNHLSEIAAGAESSKPAVAIQVLATVQADITGNVVKSLAINNPNAQNGAAIVIIGGGDMRISGNRLSDLRPRNNDYIAGMDLVVPFKSATISGNTILHAAEGTEKVFKWQAIRIVPPAVGQTLSHLDVMTFRSSENVFFLLTGSRLYPLALMSANDASVTISGNKIVAQQSEVPLVVVESPSAIFFTTNYCESPSKKKDDSGMVMLKGNIVIVAQNHVRSYTKKTPITIYSTHYTVMGNITDFPIRIESDGRFLVLSEPWKSLNIESLSG